MVSCYLDKGTHLTLGSSLSKIICHWAPQEPKSPRCGGIQNIVSLPGWINVTHQQLCVQTAVQYLCSDWTSSMGAVDHIRRSTAAILDQPDSWCNNASYFFLYYAWLNHTCLLSVCYNAVTVLQHTCLYNQAWGGGGGGCFMSPGRLVDHEERVWFRLASGTMKGREIDVKGFGYCTVFALVKLHFLITLKLSIACLTYWQAQIYWFPLDGYYERDTKIGIHGLCSESQTSILVNRLWT